MAAKLGDEAAEFLELEAQLVAEAVELPGQHEVGDHVHEGLVGGERLLVGAAAEDDRAGGVGLAGKRGRQAGLPDPGLARGKHEAPLAPRRRLERAPQGGERPLAAHEGPVLGLRERGRQGQLLVLLRLRAPVRRDEHLLVERAQLGRGRRAELLAQQHAHALEGLKRLGVVPAGRVGSHQEPVARLAERRQLDKLTRGELSPHGPLAPDRERCLRQDLERLQPVVLLGAPVLLEPGSVEERHQLVLVDVQRDLCMGARGLGVGGKRGAGRVERRLGGLDVHDRVRRQVQPKLGAALEHLGAERAPEPGQQRAERGRGIARHAGRPERAHQLVAGHRAVAVQDEVGEQGAAEPPGRLPSTRLPPTSSRSSPGVG